MRLAPGSRLGAYEVVGPIGAGGMGEVYRARDPRLRRDVALKVLPASLASDPDRLARFEREAHAVAALSHPHILAIHDFGSDNGVAYAVMELLEGQSLRDTLRGGALPRRKALDYARQIASALDASHARGIVHRDLKPDNVFVSPGGHVKVLDFGLAANRPSAPAPELTDAPTAGGTEPGLVMGTAGYMSPEQVRGEVVDHRSDIFSFGCVLYEMLSGQRAFKGESSIDTMHATLHSEPRNLSALANVPAPIVRLVEHCLGKDRSQRMQTARDLIFALDTMSDAAAPSRRKVGIAAAALLAVVAVGGTVGWVMLRDRQAPAASTSSAARGIAVLPFENLAGPDQAYFAAGVTEEVTLQIARISALRVMSRPAVARFKDPMAELPAMARELGIGAVLAGSVRHGGDRVRVGVQLLAAPSGEMLWSEQYDGDVAKVLDVQSNVALGVAQALQASLAPEERARIQRVSTANAEAYQLYLQQQLLSLGAPAQNQKGIEVLQKAIALDPDFAVANAALARRYVFRGTVYGRVDYLRGVEAGRNAVRINPQLARGHFALGSALYRAGEIDGARLSMQRAIELDTSSIGAMQSLSALELNAGRLDQSAYWAMRAWPLGPNVPFSYYTLAHSLMFLDDSLAHRWLAAAASRFKPEEIEGGEQIVSLQALLALRQGNYATAVSRARNAVRARPQNVGSTLVLTEIATYAATADAEALVERALEERPDGRGVWAGYTPRTLRAHLHVRAGQFERARPLLEAALALNRRANDDGNRSIGVAYENVAVLAMLGDRQLALDAWERAVELGFPEDRVAAYDPLIASVKDDPRFVAGLERVRRRNAEMRARVDLSVVEQWIARGAPAAGH